ncbi:MAG: DUF4345 domain-containing protein [Deltaproteobacteria bacterium]|nr:MAG: DUF4345 domain-containing protein [Deltaproteobacteria bacterium]
MTVVVALFFLGMGLVGLAAPERVAATFGTPLSAEGRNEVRAVYGGFGIAIGALLLAAPARPDVPLCVAVALAGMAGGRLVAAVLEPPRRFYPCWFYFTVETLMAVALLAR